MIPFLLIHCSDPLGLAPEDVRSSTEASTTGSFPVSEASKAGADCGFGGPHAVDLSGLSRRQTWKNYQACPRDLRRICLQSLDDMASAAQLMRQLLPELAAGLSLRPPKAKSRSRTQSIFKGSESRDGAPRPGRVTNLYP